MDCKALDTVKCQKTVQQGVKKLYKQLINTLFPPLCCHCQTREWVYVCPVCLETVFSYPDVCFYCRNRSWSQNVCEECVSILDRIIVCFSYRWAIKSAIKALKYKDYKAIIQPLIQKALRSQPLDQYDSSNTVITYIPMHRRKQYRKRWYNQGSLLAKELSKQTWLPCVNLCKKIKLTKSQTKFSRNKRKMNVYNTFTLSKSLANHIKHVIIVDDIVTTWSTLSTVAWLLKKHYSLTSVVWYCLARQ